MKLVDIGKGFKLEEAAALDWERLVLAAAKEGIYFTINTAYRDKAHQTRLYTKYVKDIAAWEKAGRKTTKPTPVAAPGRSLHEQGRAIDISVNGRPLILSWLKKNAKNFGWLQTLPSVEPWHFEHHPNAK